MFLDARLVCVYHLESSFMEYFPNEKFDILFPEDVLQRAQDFFFYEYPNEIQYERQYSYTTVEEFLETLTKDDNGVYQIFHVDMLIWLIRCGKFDSYDGQYCMVSDFF